MGIIKNIGLFVVMFLALLIGEVITQMIIMYLTHLNQDKTFWEMILGSKSTKQYIIEFTLLSLISLPISIYYIFQQKWKLNNNIKMLNISKYSTTAYVAIVFVGRIGELVMNKETPISVFVVSIVYLIFISATTFSNK